MNLASYISTILATSKTDWTSVMRPVFLQSASEVQANTARWIEIEEHDALYTLKSDLAVSIAVGLPRSGSFSEPWAANFPDPNPRAYYADMCINGRPIERVMVVTVDGGRATLPLPNGGSLEVPTNRKRFTCLVDELQGGTKFDDYFRRAGLKEISEYWPK